MKKIKTKLNCQVFYVGGPNQRKDYHLEEGEELFFMRKGDMTLKVFANGKFSDVDIKEGEV
jgi:3-hydroxyanthranilate 3,4-dioxygenase